MCIRDRYISLVGYKPHYGCIIDIYVQILDWKKAYDLFIFDHHKWEVRVGDTITSVTCILWKDESNWQNGVIIQIPIRIRGDLHHYMDEVVFVELLHNSIPVVNSGNFGILVSSKKDPENIGWYQGNPQTPISIPPVEETDIDYKTIVLSEFPCFRECAWMLDTFKEFTVYLGKLLHDINQSIDNKVGMLVEAINHSIHGFTDMYGRNIMFYVKYLQLEDETIKYLYNNVKYDPEYKDNFGHTIEEWRKICMK